MNNTTTTNNTRNATLYDAERVEKLQKMVARINKKLDTAELERVGLTIDEAIENHRKVYRATVTFPTLEEMGWEVQAVVKAAPDFGSYHHIIRGQEDSIPTRFWDAPMACEHCGYERRRKSTVIVRHTEDHRWMQVGSTCVKDFLGGGADKILAGLNALDRVTAELDEAERTIPSGNYAIYYEPETVLSATIQHLMDNGGNFVPTNGLGTRAPGSTAAEVGAKLDAAYRAGTLNDVASDRAEKAAEDCLAWLAGYLTDAMRGSDSYLRNLETAAYNPTTPDAWANDSGFAILVSLPNFWRDTVRGPQQPTEEVSEVAGRIELRGARVASRRELEDRTYNGRRTRRQLVKLVVGNRWFTWFAYGGAADGMQRGACYNITATVKGEDTYRGVTSTIINRCSYEAA